jgi:lambda family phage portal protein
MSHLLDSKGAVIPRGTGARLRRQASSLSGTGGDTQYRGASARDAALANWNPLNVSADLAAQFDRNIVTARTRDLIRNNGIARAAIVKQSDMVVGRQFRFLSLPDHRALGVDRETAAAFGQALEAVWRAWAEDPLRRCDRVRRHNFAGLVNLAYREMCSVNEAIAVVRDRPRRGWGWRTAIQLIDSDRLSNPRDLPDGSLSDAGYELKGGIEFDPAGEPLAYHVRNRHPLDVTFRTNTYTWTRTPRETAWGRPVFIHAFESDRAEQTRGISPFASILAVFRMIDRHSQAELANAVANSLFVAFIKSSYDPYAVQEGLATGDNPIDQAKSWQEIRADIYNDAPVNLGGSQIPVMPPGDEIEMNQAARDTASFGEFRSVFLQEIASAIGMPYVALAERWDQVNYSSARAALNEVWRAVQSRRAAFVEQFVNPILMAVLEEAIVTGKLDIPAGAPSLYENPAAYLRGMWVGPGRGYVDPQKEAQGAALRVENNFSTLEREAAEQGLDWEELLDQRAREVVALKERELTAALAGTGEQPAPPENPETGNPIGED